MSLRDGGVVRPCLGAAVVGGAAHHKDGHLGWEGPRGGGGQGLDDGVPAPEHLLQREQRARLGVAQGETLERDHAT